MSFKKSRKKTKQGPEVREFACCVCVFCCGFGKERVHLINLYLAFVVVVVVGAQQNLLLLLLVDDVEAGTVFSRQCPD